MQHARRHRFRNNEEVLMAIRKWLRKQSSLSAAMEL